MGESLIQQYRVCEEGLRVVKHFQLGGKQARIISRLLTLPLEEAPANSVPAAAVIRRVQALIGITGRKAFVGGYLS
ncbi:conserved hypothetical protein [Bathymodiolus platifrons methanotrophic gill symbiont]|nr:conserved hypothetical protein [Bathymodiolus platifrons methanotrophic gill symbiont]